MEGSLTGERLTGSLPVVAARRTDYVNLPTLRGMLDTVDGAQVWVEPDGIPMLRAEDQAPVFVTTFRFRTGDERYTWLNTTFGVLESVLDTVGVGGRARGRLYGCRPTLS